MRLTTEQMTELRNYCKSHISNFDSFVSIALDEMDEMRIPLVMCSCSLSEKLWSCFEDWCEDKKLNPYDIDIEMDELI